MLTHFKLVVVGDQSSGKSSVLEGSTNLPFPRDSGPCTRFPTQIVFTRSEYNFCCLTIRCQMDAVRSFQDDLMQESSRA